VTQLTEVVERGYLVSLDAEQTAYHDLVAGRAIKWSESTHFEGLPEFIRVAAYEHQQMLKNKESAAKALADGLRKFGQGHREMAQRIDKASLKEAVQVARDYADQIQQVIQSFNH
jgi:hypothetical protein